jgi:hypothetical protein
MTGAGILSAMFERVLPIMCLGLLCFSAVSQAGDLRALDVQPQPMGGIKATATLVFPVEPAVLQRILTDYRHWPDLFEARMRIAELREQNGVAFTDIRIDHALIPGERRLLCESRPLPAGGLVTELRGGDFKQYRRVWKLTAIEGGSRTQADFELLIEIETIVPEWMVAIAMRQELEAHFRMVHQQALAVMSGGK